MGETDPRTGDAPPAGSSNVPDAPAPDAGEEFPEAAAGTVAATTPEPATPEADAAAADADADAAEPDAAEPVGSGEPAEPIPAEPAEPISAAPSDEPIPAESPRPRRRRHRTVLALAASFAVALVAGSALIAGAVAGYVQSYEGRILPGVRVGDVDLSGLDRAGAAAALDAAFAGFSEGRLSIDAGSATVEVDFTEIARRPDTEAMLDEALAVGAGSGVPRALALLGLAREGVVLEPRMTYDEAALDAAVARGLGALERDPVDATIAMGRRGIVTTSARDGRTYDIAAAAAAAHDAIGRLDAPAEIRISAEPASVPPARSDAVVAAIRAQAERMVADVVVTLDGKRWTIKAATVRGWVGLEPSVEEAVRPVIARERIAPALRKVADGVRRKAASATFLKSRTGKIVGVRTGRNGRRLDVASTTDAIAAELGARARGVAPAPVTAVVEQLRPKLSNAEALKVAPRMVLLGSWTTRFEISERNFYGANIWLPARYISGTLLRPGQRFEWFSAVGPITPARGFGSGGVIRGSYSDPTGAIGGGMCSSSTTLFNAALRAGLRMGSRANHTYYIDRYPLGLDATVWIEGGRTQTMSFTNDMRTPILILGYKASSGGYGFVTYEIWGVPDGRTVSISAPAVRNVLPATTDVRETSTLPPGVRKQTEWAANGMDVWVTRVVRSASGAILHRETWYSHYRRWTGIILVGAR